MITSSIKNLYQAVMAYRLIPFRPPRPAYRGGERQTPHREKNQKERNQQNLTPKPPAQLDVSSSRLAAAFFRRAPRHCSTESSLNAAALRLPRCHSGALEGNSPPANNGGDNRAAALSGVHFPPPAAGRAAPPRGGFPHSQTYRTFESL